MDTASRRPADDRQGRDRQRADVHRTSDGHALTHVRVCVERAHGLPADRWETEGPRLRIFAIAGRLARSGSREPEMPTAAVARVSLDTFLRPELAHVRGSVVTVRSPVIRVQQIAAVVDWRAVLREDLSRLN
jgi:hypothetical protein